MNLHYSNILLFSFSLNILALSSYAHNKNKPCFAPRHIRTITSRVLSECDLNTSIYDKDPDMKSVKENFDRQTSQRFEEYNERMITQRKKCKEQRDKDVQKIILKDKIEKSLEEKVEKVCLRCGCGLGGVAASVGIFGAIAVGELKKAATTAAIELAKEAGAAAAEAVGAEAGKNAVIAELQKMGISTVGVQGLQSYFVTTDYTNALTISRAIIQKYDPSSCPINHDRLSDPFCNWLTKESVAARNIPVMTRDGAVSVNAVINRTVENIVSDAKKAAGKATEKAIEEAIKSSTAGVESTYASCQTAIIASVVAIVVIALVMIIIYLVLRYRRKKKMNKKAQYTELLNQ